MTMSRRILSILLRHLLLFSLLTAHAEAAAPPTVILLSLDGTRPADVTAQTLPSLVELARRGASARGLIPATPSNTFPSHVTLVTGVAPDRHGIVNNSFVDAERGRFRKKEIPSWIQVEPLWSLLAAQGVVSASYHWVGSEGPWESGLGPRHWRAFARSTSAVRKVETILSWLDLEDPAARPRFITAWFSGADHAAHRSGPGSDAALAQLARHESALRTLIDGMGARDLWATTTLIVVSDHGMARADKLVDLDRAFDEAGIAARVSGVGGFATVILDRDQAARSGVDAPRVSDPAAEVEVIVRGLGLEPVRRGELHGGSPFTNPRFGDFVIRAPIGTAIHRPGVPTGGFHGYASTEPEMHGLFIARGRGISPGHEFPLLRAIDIAPTVLGLLGVEIPEWMQGSPITLDGTRIRE
ncbi:MAG: alkaline phosphatase family protein [bacterium]|nr:alkaline phosphatase family protein [bacterium]